MAKKIAEKNKTNVLAIISLVLGVLSLVFFLTAPVAIILGIVSLVQIKKNPQPGKGLAIAGIILGAVSLLIVIVWLLFVGLMVFSQVATLS